MKTNGSSKDSVQPVVITRTIESAVLLLQRAGARFRVVAPNGHEYGDLEVKKVHYKHKYPSGTLRDLYVPHVKNLGVGEVAQIPVGTFPPGDVRAALAGWCGKVWGRGMYRTAITGDMVEVLRVG